MPCIVLSTNNIMTQYSLHSWNHALQVYQLSLLNFDLNLQDSTTVYRGMYFQFVF